MFTNREKIFRAVGLCLAAVFLSPAAGARLEIRGQQEADPGFDARVARPAYTNKHPKVLVDEAHNNFHTAGGRYKPFADLVASDGYRVFPNKEKFGRKTLEGYDVLVVANALGNSFAPDAQADDPAFTEEECDAVRDWVLAGGALLLVADHAPAGGAAETLSKKFGVEMSSLYTLDTANADLADGGNEGWIVYSRENGLLADHPITRGRGAAERVNRVVAFTGQSLKAVGGGGAVFLRLADTAGDFDPSTKKEVSAAGRAPTRREITSPSVTSTTRVRTSRPSPTR